MLQPFRQTIGRSGYLGIGAGLWVLVLAGLGYSVRSEPTTGIAESALDYGRSGLRVHPFGDRLLAQMEKP